MCYHASSPVTERLQEVVGNQVQILPYPQSTFLNGFDKPLLPVLLNAAPRIVQPVIWDFTPNSGNFSYTTLNAKCETLFTSPLFGESARTRRCLVFLQGMYEWSPVGGTKAKKKPYYIERNDNQPFAAGGIWKDWGNGRVTFSIVTTPANELFKYLRPEVPRMLFIPERSIWNAWLNTNTPIEELSELMIPYKDGEFVATPLAESPLKKKPLQ